VTAGSYHSCALTASGDAYCWGDGEFGQLGDSTQGSTTPQLVLGGHTFVAIAAGATHICALATGGAAYCWGNDTNGQLGTSVPLDVCAGTRVGDVLCSLIPVPVAGGLSFASLTTGFHHTCGVTTAGLAYCWGLNDLGQLGSQAGRGSITPVRVANQPR
jgi:alpha-tubulin suppressor-like RCC1 family protein